MAMTLLKLHAAAAALRRRAVPALLLACAGAAGAGAARAEEAVLLASTAPGYTPGMVVAAGEPLLLPEGASVTLLFRSGQMLRLRGPAQASLDLAAPARREGVVTALAEAFRLRGVDASVIGGARATGFARVRPQMQDVMVDAQRSGTYCVGPADTVWLTRPPAATEATLALRRRGNLRAIAWPGGAARIEWPSDLPIEDGDRFEVLAGGGAALATLTFRTVAGAPPSEAAAIAEGLLLGCHEQHEGALRRLARAAVPQELWLTTERGRSPVYRSGEPIGLTAMAATDGWLYCVSVRADGTAAPVFPGGAAESARLPGAVPAAIPGQRRAAGLQAGPRGLERIRCWLADRDIAPELPHALLGPASARLPDRLAADLDAIFAGIGGSRITTAALEIRVE
jgi:Domain of unknown function (DUF4384)